MLYGIYNPRNEMYLTKTNAHWSESPDDSRTFRSKRAARKAARAWGNWKEFLLITFELRPCFTEYVYESSRSNRPA